MEDTPHGKLGRGIEGNGENRLGKLWEEVREEAKTGELQPRGRVVAQAPQGQGVRVVKGKVGQGNRKGSATQIGQYASNEKQQKQGVTLVLSDSMLKDFRGWYSVVGPG